MRRAAGWFVVAGVLALAGFVAPLVAPGSGEGPVVVLRVVAGVTTGIALLRLWRRPPLPGGAFWLLLAGLGALTQALGLALGEWTTLPTTIPSLLFVVGGAMVLICLGAAGLGALITHSDRRVCGAFYLVGGLSAGVVGVGSLVAAVTWLSFAWWLRRRDPATGDMG